ncbi:MAG: hypothetical protein ACREFW_06825 [Rhizomicrobium sp.]
MSRAPVPLLTEHGVRHEWIDHGDGTYTVASSQDVEPILERNRAMANHNDGYTPSRDLRRLASIPNVVLLGWLNDLLARGATMAESMKTLQDPKFIKRKLDDSNWAYLRTSDFVAGC